jgi:hypothetical protein
MTCWMERERSQGKKREKGGKESRYVCLLRTGSLGGEADRVAGDEYTHGLANRDGTG